jgi:hypothetical protein
MVAVCGETQRSGLENEFQICFLVTEQKLSARLALAVNVCDFKRIVAEHLDMLNRDR